MALAQLRTTNLGKTRANLTGSTGVGYTLVNSDQSILQTRTTTGVYQLTSGSGIYSAYVTFPDSFNGTILWDSGESGDNIVYAAEQYNTEENDGRIYPILQTVSGTVSMSAIDIQFLVDIEGGRWKIDTATNRMTFYKADNITPVAVFDLKDAVGAPTTEAPFERVRVP